METKGSDSIDIAASPERVYNLLIDLTRIGEISPECAEAAWLDGVQAPHAGRALHGYEPGGALRVDHRCCVLRAMPGVEWAFKSNVASYTPITWRYGFKPTDAGCTVKVTWDAPLLGLPRHRREDAGTRRAAEGERRHLAGQPQAAGRGLTRRLGPRPAITPTPVVTKSGFGLDCGP